MPAGLDVAFGRDHILSRSFFILPLEHSEDLADQESAIAHFQDILEHAPEAMRAVAELQIDAARKHRDLVERFGRCV